MAATYIVLFFILLFIVLLLGVAILIFLFGPIVVALFSDACEDWKVIMSEIKNKKKK